MPVTTQDIISKLKPNDKGEFFCPRKGCPQADKAFMNAQALTIHLRFGHGIKSPKAKEAHKMYVASKNGHKKNGHVGKYVKKAKLDLPERMIHFCPNCGYDLGTAEKAAFLLAQKAHK